MRLRFTSVFWFIYTIFVKWLTRLINRVCGWRWPRRCSTDRYPNMIVQCSVRRCRFTRDAAASGTGVVKSRKQFYENREFGWFVRRADRRVIRDYPIRSAFSHNPCNYTRSLNEYRKFLAAGEMRERESTQWKSLSGKPTAR